MGRSKQNESTGHDWRKNTYQRKRKASRTAGIMKNENCKASPLERYMARRSRSYKHRDYAQWSKSHQVTT
jgi:hypothetical protein